MEKEHKHEITVTKTTHEFFCDECGKSLGISEEYSDGYWHSIGKVGPINCHLSDLGFMITYPAHHYCHDCRKKVRNRMIKQLKDIGFECAISAYDDN